MKKQQAFDNFLQKKKWPLILFWLIVIIILSAILSLFLYFIIKNNEILEPIAITYVTVGTFICLITAFLGIKPMYDISFALLMKKRIRSQHLQIINNSSIMPDVLPTVAIVVPTYNDFMPRETKQSFAQTYRGGIKFYILDDSTDKDQIQQINDFAKKNNVTVLRQTKENRSQYGKGCGLAAAFNYFIHQTKNEWDFMVHLDSGDLLDHDYVQKTIPFFYANRKIGIVGSKYSSYRVNFVFQNHASFFTNELSIFYIGATQYQNTGMPGAGIVYSKHAIYDVGKWPNTMNEDVAMSSEILQKGYDTLWTNITHCMQRECLNVISMQKRWGRIFFGTHDMNKIKTNNAHNFFSFSCWIKLTFYLTPVFFTLTILNEFLLIFITKDNMDLILKFVLWQNLCFIGPIIILLIPILVNVNYSFIGKNITYVLFGLVEAICLAPVVLLKLIKTFFNLFILRKKEINFAITSKKNVNINSEFIKNIIMNVILIIIIIIAYILLAYFFNLYYQLLPLAITIVCFPLAFCILDIISMLKTKINYDAQETVEGISLF